MHEVVKEHAFTSCPRQGHSKPGVCLDIVASLLRLIKLLAFFRSTGWGYCLGPNCDNVIPEILQTTGPDGVPSVACSPDFDEFATSDNICIIVCILISIIVTLKADAPMAAQSCLMHEATPATGGMNVPNLAPCLHQPAIH
jgi:hypothetical protein